jgi:CBS domain-containing protein
MGRKIVKTARENMCASVECASTNDSIMEAAKKMRDLSVGALADLGEDNRLKGMLTDRDPTAAGHRRS